MSVIINGVEIAPCICSKAKFALGLDNNYRGNRKTCSQNYWNRIVNYLGNENRVMHAQIEQARGRVDLFRPY